MSKLCCALKKHHIAAVVRGVSREQLLPAAGALYDGGIRIFEITFERQDAASIKYTAEEIAALKKTFGDKIFIGAGTVLTEQQADAAAAAGAGYILSPNFSPKMTEYIVGKGLEAVPGAFTPSEIASAWEAGASVVKLFPASFAGVSYIKSLSAPLGHIPLLAMGGITADNIMSYIKLPNIAGAGISAALVNKALIADENWQQLTAGAKKFTDILAGV